MGVPLASASYDGTSSTSGGQNSDVPVATKAADECYR